MQVTRMPDGSFHREFFTGREDRDLHDAMDARLRDLEAQGHTFALRTKIGRNTTCPCGSGRKFKKCCIDRAQQVAA